MLGMRVAKVNEGCTIIHPSHPFALARQNRIIFSRFRRLYLLRRFHGWSGFSSQILRHRRRYGRRPRVDEVARTFCAGRSPARSVWRQRCGLRPHGEARQQRKQLRAAQGRDGFDEGAWKYANRYGYPDGNVVEAIAAHHGLKPENVLLTAGSGEVLQVVGTTFLQGGKKVDRRRPVLRLGLPARHQHQGRGDQAAAPQGLPARTSPA